MNPANKTKQAFVCMSEKFYIDEKTDEQEMNGPNIYIKSIQTLLRVSKLNA